MNKKGFTLIELLVVIAIIGLLATIAVVSFGSANTKAKNAKKMADIRTIQSALELYNTDQSSYPVLVTANTWATLGTTMASYFQGGLPTPPDGTTSFYIICSNATKYLLRTTLSSTAAIEGDVDGTASGWTTDTCVQTSGVEAVPGADFCGPATGADTQFCLGSLSSS